MKVFILQISLLFLLLSYLYEVNIYANNTRNSDSIKFNYTYAEALKNKMLGRNEPAKKQFKECLKINPNSTASAYQLAKILFKEENIDEAKKYSEFCIKHQADNEWFLLLRAQIARKRDNTNLYKSIYEKLVSTYPNNLDYNYELAVTCYETKDYHKALSLLNEIQTQIGVNESVSLLKNSIYYKQKQFGFIEIELKTLQKTFPDSSKYSDMLADFYIRFNRIDHAISIYTNSLKQDSANVNSKFALAWLYAQKENYAKGIPFLQSVIPNPNIQFDRIFKVADLYLNARNNEVSDEHVSSILTLLSKKKDFNGKFLEKYITHLYSKKDLSNAEKYALMSIEKFPDNYSSWNLYFEILLTLNRYDALNKSAKKCLEYFPNQASVYFYCGYSHFLLKQYKKAVGYLKTSIDYSADNEDLTLQNYLIIAESYHSMGEHKKSDQYFEKYIHKNSSNADLMNNYAYYLLQRGSNYEKALKLSRKSLEIEPFNSSFLDTYAWILFAQEKYDMALNYIQRAYKYGGEKNPTVLDHYGDIYNKLGNTDDANIMWKEAYRISKSKAISAKIRK